MLPSRNRRKNKEELIMTNTSCQNACFSESPNEDFLKTIEQLLGNAGSGSFTEECLLPSGLKVTHRLSLAVGFGSLHELQQYRSKFGEPPDWLRFCHPYHRSKLCRMARETNIRLPKSFNYLSAYIQKIQKSHENYRKRR